MWRVWGDPFHVAFVRESKLTSTTSSWNNLEEKTFPQALVFCVTHEYVRWGGLSPVKGKMRLFFTTASAICTTNLLVHVFMKLGRGCSLYNLVHSNPSSVVKGIF